MKVLIVAPTFYPAVVYGGPIVSTLQLAKHLVKEGVDVYVSTTNANRPNKLNVKNNSWMQFDTGIQIKYYNDTIVERISIPFLFGIYKDMKKVDAVHINYLFSTTTLFSLWSAVFLNKKILLAPRGSMASWILSNGIPLKKVWLFLFIKPFIKFFTWHATAQQEVDEIKSFFLSAKTMIAPNGVDLEQVKPMPLDRNTFVRKYTSIENCSYCYISMGRLQKKKGFDILIKSFSTLNDAKSVLLIAGEDDGEKENLLNLIYELKLEKNIVLIGHLKGADTYTFLSSGDVFVLPSHNENFGNVYAEALACGTPIIASKNTPWKDVVEAKCGLWVDNTIEATAKAMLEIKTMNKEDWSRNAITFARQLSWNEVSKKIKNYLNN
jgi:glycosyltransferase involved in cell wall biosynthesis